MRHPVGWLPASTLVLAVQGLPVAASAEDASEVETDDEPEADGLAEVGRAAFLAQRWDDAILAFEEAYGHDPRPGFLFNLAKAHQKKGDLGGALLYFERYLKEAPDARDRKQVKTALSFLKAKVKRK